MIQYHSAVYAALDDCLKRRDALDGLWERAVLCSHGGLVYYRAWETEAGLGVVVKNSVSVQVVSRANML